MDMASLFDSVVDALVAEMRPIAERLAALPLEQQVEALNRLRTALHEAGPFAGEPVDCVLWAPADDVRPNDYNPNSVAPPEMRLLRHSIRVDGYTQPIVAWRNNGDLGVVDGEHRSRVGKEDPAVRRRVRGYLPVVVVNHGRTATRDRMAATIRHNRARGVHGVMPMADIVAAMLREGWADDEIARELGMDADEVLRFKQQVALPELFRGHEYSAAWE
jgi:ParB-like chromosome segregation protein Spo0J